MHLRLFDLDGSLDGQLSLLDAAPWSSVVRVPMRDLAQELRLWSRAKTMCKARDRVADALSSAEPAITMIGSGDYHHLAVLLMERARERITIVHFDNHPDWVRWAPRWHCGSWVNQALELEQVARVVTLGPASEDLVRPELKGANLAALAAGNIVLFPWQHAPSRVWRRIADGPGHRYQHGYLIWRNLAGMKVTDNVDLILDQIDTDAIWLTIDKDVLAESEALTNWDQGQMPLQAMLDLIAAIGAKKRIAGADICGEFSVPAMHNPLKRFESRFDRPQRIADPAGLARNESVNGRLLMAIERAAA